jgi:hypothetical protein
MLKAKSIPLLLLALCTATALAQPPQEARSGAEAAAAAAAAARTVSFAGQTWTVKNSAGAFWGPGPNRFSDNLDNVWVDDLGRLHLAITNTGGVWQCAEVISNASFGYGTYTFTIETPLDALDRNVVLGLFTWSDNRAENHREIDIEFARWGDVSNPYNAYYTVQPYTVNGKQQAWDLGTGWGATAHSFRWSSRSVDFTSRTIDGNTVLRQWTYSKRQGIPRPGGENARMNLWLFNGAAPTNGQPVEVIVSAFTFVP